MSEQPEQLEQSEPPQQRRLAGRVAVVGFPNAGKSTLINRLTSSRQAVVHETPGVTRDRTESVCEWRGREFVLIDTGGVDPGDDSPMQSEVAEQARIAVQEAHLVLLVIDARAGLAAGDEEIAQILRRSRRPVIGWSVNARPTTSHVPMVTPPQPLVGVSLTVHSRKRRRSAKP